VPLAGPEDLSQGGLRRSRALIEQAWSGGDHAAALQLDSTNAEARIPTLSKLLILKLIGMELKWPVGVPQQEQAVGPPQRPRFGSGRIYRLLTQRGWTVNEKRVHRLWKREHMQVLRKQHRKRQFPGGSENGCVRHRARYKNHVWSYDFVADRTEDGRQLRLLVVIDEYTRECLAIEVGRSFTAQDVMGVLQYLFAVRGTPEHIRSDNLGNDNGPEFVSKVICRWLKEADIKTLFIAKGSPWENGDVESFNGTLRDELLNREIFLSFEEACWVIDRWRLDYNHHRIHSSLDYQTPAAYAAGCVLPASATPQPPEHSRFPNPNSLTHTGAKTGG
jgi:transposase InsO family protein